MGTDIKRGSGTGFLMLALLAFAGLGIEVLLAFLLEPLLYGCGMQEWSAAQNICHWILTCICWGGMSVLLIRTAKRKYSFDVFEKQGRMKPYQRIAVIALLVLMLVWSYLDWKGFKVLKEFQYNGWLKFMFQYIYYLFETVLVVLIIVFGQKAFELWFHGNSRVMIPYGGILAGLTWGMTHALTKGSLNTGISLLVTGILYGVTYLLVCRDVRKAYILILLMFVL